MRTEGATIMTDETQAPPSTKQLLARLAVPRALPGGGLESAVIEVEASPLSQKDERLETSRRVLKELAAQHHDVNESVVDLMIGDADEALRKLDGEGGAAELAPPRRSASKP
jgi:hypothetical protein